MRSAARQFVCARPTVRTALDRDAPPPVDPTELAEAAAVDSFLRDIPDASKPVHNAQVLRAWQPSMRVQEIMAGPALEEIETDFLARPSLRVAGEDEPGDDGDASDGGAGSEAADDESAEVELQPVEPGLLAASSSGVVVLQSPTASVVQHGLQPHGGGLLPGGAMHRDEQ